MTARGLLAAAACTLGLLAASPLPARAFVYDVTYVPDAERTNWAELALQGGPMLVEGVAFLTDCAAGPSRLDATYDSVTRQLSIDDVVLCVTDVQLYQLVEASEIRVTAGLSAGQPSKVVTVAPTGFVNLLDLPVALSSELRVLGITVGTVTGTDVVDVSGKLLTDHPTGDWFLDDLTATIVIDFVIGRGADRGADWDYRLTADLTINLRSDAEVPLSVDAFEGGTLGGWSGVGPPPD